MTARGRSVAKGRALLPFLAVAVAVILAAGRVGAAAGELPRQDLPAPVLDSLREALAAYEEVRSELTADRLDGASTGASRLSDALRSTVAGDEGLAEDVRDVVREAARIAGSMAEAQDLGAARVAFGEVSRRVLLLAGSDPRLVEGWHVFACPMAAGFERWIQPSPELDNPYMGTAMPRCGSAADWSAPEPSAAEQAQAPAREERSSDPPAPRDGEPAEQQAAAPEPVFRDGIPGVRMVDVRDHRFLWREIDELQLWEHGDRLTVAEYRGKVIEKTVHFLELEKGAADAFTAAAAAAVVTLREAFLERPESGGGTSGVEGRFSAELEAAVARIDSLLQEEPRHRLFAPESKKWLLRLTFGPREAKEATEAEQARTGSLGLTSTDG